MPYTEVFDALGGGMVGLLGVAVLVLAGLLVHQYEVRLKEHKERIADQDQQIKDQTAALTRLSDVVESWTPNEQRRRLRQP